MVGDTPSWRDLETGSEGPDVTQLQQGLGGYSSRTPFDELDSGLVVAGRGEPVQTLTVVARDATGAQVTRRAVLALLARADASDARLRSPVSLAELERTVLGDLAGFGRGLLVLVLAPVPRWSRSWSSSTSWCGGSTSVVAGRSARPGG